MFPTNVAHWHLLLNHVPIFFAGIGLALLLIGIIRESFELKVTSLVCLFLAGSIVIPVAYTGEQAEHLIEDYGGIDDPLMEQHEETGETTRNVVIFLGLLALGSAGFYFRSNGLPNWYLYVVLVVGIVGMYYLVKTATLGGKARHVEIRSPTISTQTPALNSEENENRLDETD